jgi:hypothetical protein
MVRIPFSNAVIFENIYQVTFRYREAEITRFCMTCGCSGKGVLMVDSVLYEINNAGASGETCFSGMVLYSEYFLCYPAAYALLLFFRAFGCIFKMNLFNRPKHHPKRSLIECTPSMASLVLPIPTHQE